MSLPIRRVTPQPRVRPVRPRLITPAAENPRQTTAATRSHVWIPRPKISPSRLIRPAAENSRLTIKATQAHIWPRVRPMRSRLVTPAPLVAAVIPPPTRARQGVRRPIGKQPRPRIIVAPLVVVTTPQVRAIRGRIWPRVAPLIPTQVKPAIFVAPVIPPPVRATRASHALARPRIKPVRPRLFLAPAVVIPVITAYHPPPIGVPLGEVPGTLASVPIASPGADVSGSSIPGVIGTPTGEVQPN